VAGAVPIGIGRFRPERLEPVLLPSEFEGGFAPFHDAFDSFAYLVHVDGALASDLPARLISSSPIVTPGNKLSIAVHDEVRIMTREYELALLLRLPTSPGCRGPLPADR
jgi:hypothetical protein